MQACTNHFTKPAITPASHISGGLHDDSTPSQRTSQSQSGTFGHNGSTLRLHRPVAERIVSVGDRPVDYKNTLLPQDADERFLYAFAHLQALVASKPLSGGQYVAQMIAFLCRQLLMDKQPLHHVVNRPGDRRLNIEFECSPFDGSLPDDPELRRILQKASIRFGRTAFDHPSERMKLEQFLATGVLSTRQRVASVRDIIDFAAHVKGGVHFGRLESDIDAELASACAIGRVRGVQAPLIPLWPIGRVTVRAMNPLHELTQQTQPASRHTPEIEITSAGPRTVFAVLSNADGSKSAVARIQEANGTQSTWSSGEGLADPSADHD